MSGQIEMPKYKSHKEVWALKIKSVDATTVTPEDAGYAPFEVPEQYIAKHDPKAGGYYVVYEDGYQSFSPAEAFESGYTAAAPASPAASVMTDAQITEMAVEHLGIDYDRMPHGVLTLSAPPPCSVYGDQPKCAAHKQGTAGGNALADCDWPGCGCDKAATRLSTRSPNPVCLPCQKRRKTC